MEVSEYARALIAALKSRRRWARRNGHKFMHPGTVAVENLDGLRDPKIQAMPPVDERGVTRSGLTPAEQIRVDWELVFVARYAWRTRNADNPVGRRVRKMSVDAIDVLFSDEGRRYLTVVVSAFEDVAGVAAMMGRIDLIDRLYRYYWSHLDEIPIANEADRLEVVAGLRPGAVLQLARGVGLPTPVTDAAVHTVEVWTAIACKAALCGQNDTLEHMRRMGVLYTVLDPHVGGETDSLTHAASAGGQPATLRLLRTWGLMPTTDDANDAAYYGELETIELLHEWGIDCDRYGASAALDDHFDNGYDVLRRLHEWGIDCTTDDANRCVKAGAREALMLLHSWGIDCNEDGAHINVVDLLAEWGLTVRATMMEIDDE